jgi:signal transduction histidine kinase
MRPPARRRWNVALPAGRDERGDNNWDGFYRAFGPFTAHLPDGPRAALLVGIEAGHDERPRGVLALDARDGTVLWQHLTGAKPVAASFHIVDLDGDGRQEICFVGAGVSNLEDGEDVDGASDDHAMLFVVNDDGRLRWRRALGPAPASACLETADLEGDGRTELVVAAFMTGLNHEDAGRARRQRRSHHLRGAARELPQPGRDDARGCGHCLAFLRWPGCVAMRCRATQSRRAPKPCSTARPTWRWSPMSWATNGWKSCWAPTAAGTGWSMKTCVPSRCCRDPEYRILNGGASLRRLPDRTQRLVVLGDPLHGSAEFVIEPSPREVPWAMIAAGLGVAGSAGLAWRRRRQVVTGQALRELRLQVLDRLELAGHGEIGALAAARNLQKYVASFEAGLIDEAKLENRFRDLAADVFEVGLPDLEAAAEVAALAQLEPEAVQKAAAALAQLRGALAAAQGGAPANDEESPALRLGEAIANTNERFRRLREIAKGHFSTAPDAVIERSLKANADTITRLGVEVVRPTSPVPDCLIDQKDLAFVLDNLIENALRAMASVTPRRLVIDWRLDGSLVVITVQDTGAGMTAAEAAAAVEPGDGKRAGGGRGLPGSCRRLKKYEGSCPWAPPPPAGERR